MQLYDQGMIIRSENSADTTAIAGVLGRSFAVEPEVVKLVDLIRDSAGYVPDLALVAEEDGSVIGFVMLSVVTIRGEQDHEVLSLAPLGVDPTHQRRGVGSALTLEALARADGRTQPLVVLEGIPDYYPRFGFESAVALGIDKPHPGVPDNAFMARRLSAYDPRCRGKLVYPRSFYEAGVVEL